MTYWAVSYNKPVLVFDMIEPFRPWIDRLLIEQFILDIPKASFFEPKEKGYWLSKTGRHYFIPLFNDYLQQRRKMNGRTLSLKNHIYRFAADFANEIKDA